MVDQEPVNILLVDDLPQNLLVLEAVLAGPGYRLVKAMSGKEALFAMLKQEFAMILLDVQMPEMSGYETATLIRQQQRSNEIPILFLTAAYKDEVSVQQGYLSGGVDYLIKPFDPQVLRSKVAMYAALYRKAHKAEKDGRLARERDRDAAECRIADLRMKSELRFKELVDNLDHTIIWVADAQTMKFSFVAKKAEELLGYPLEKWFSDLDFIGNHLVPEDKQLFMVPLEKARTEGENVRVEHRMIAYDGSIHWFQTGMQLEKGEDGSTPQVRGICVDITPAKKIQEEMQSLREEFIQALTHDLRTPLTGARLNAELVVNSSDTLHKIKYLALRLIENLERMDTMIRDLLDANLIRAGQKLPLRFKEFNLISLAENTLGGLAAVHGNRFVLKSDGSAQGYWCESALRRVIENLCNNAVKYGAPDRPVTLSLKEVEGKIVEVSVHNEGSPISQKEQASLFQPFHRTHSAEHSRHRGWGIGLTLVRGVAEAHQGKVSVKSSPEDGTTFTMSLPRQPLAQLGGDDERIREV